EVPVRADGRGDQRDRGDAGRERGPAWEAADAAGDGGGAAEEGDPAGSMPEPEHEERDGEDRGRRGGEDHLADRGAAGRGGGRGCECSAEHDIEKCNIVWCHIRGDRETAGGPARPPLCCPRVAARPKGRTVYPQSGQSAPLWCQRGGRPRPDHTKVARRSAPRGPAIAVGGLGSTPGPPLFLPHGRRTSTGKDGV